MTTSKETIMEHMEKLQKEQELCFTIPETFGGGAAIIQLNPTSEAIYPQGGEGSGDGPRFIPYWSHDKADHRGG
jgi:hypothetical protein